MAFLAVNLLYTDIHDGWLIFDPPGAEIGCHPSEKSYHEISFYCDDIQKTVAELKGRGVEFLSEVGDAGFGFITHSALPDGTKAKLYQPKYKRK